MARKILTNTTHPAEGNLHYYHLPKGLLHLRIFRGGNDLSPDYRVEIDPEVRLVPDPAHRYFLRYHANPYTSDQIEFSFSPEGFLQSVNTAVKDETGEVIQTVVDALKEAAGAAAGFKSRSIEVQIFEKYFDPFDTESKELIDEVLKNFSHTLELKPLGAEPADSGRAEGKDRFGFFCRPASAYEVILSKLALPSGRGQQQQTLESVQAMVISLPHPKVTHFVEIPMASWVNNEFSVEFNEIGYPISLRLNKPSSVLAFAQIPLNILRSILELPAMLFKIRLDMTNNQQKLAASETQFKETLLRQQDLEKRQQALAAQSGSSNTAMSRQFEEMDAKLRQLENENVLLRKRVSAIKVGRQDSDSDI